MSNSSSLPSENETQSQETADNEGEFSCGGLLGIVAVGCIALVMSPTWPVAVGVSSLAAMVAIIVWAQSRAKL